MKQGVNSQNQSRRGVLATLKKLAIRLVDAAKRLLSKDTKNSAKLARAAERDRKKKIKRELRGVGKVAA